MHRTRKFEKFAPLHLSQISFGFSILLPLFSTKKLKLVSEKCTAHASLKKCTSAILFLIPFGFSIILHLSPTKLLKQVSENVARERRSAIQTLQNCCLNNASRCSSVAEALLMHSIKTLIQKQDRQAALIYGRATRPRMVQV